MTDAARLLAQLDRGDMGMSDFRILRDVATTGLRFASDVIDTGIVDDVAHAAATRTKGVTNPLYLATFGQIGTGAFRPSLWESSASSVVRGTGSGAFDDAVRSLHELGARHGVDGISLRVDPEMYGGLKFAETGYYISGQPVIDRIGRAAAFELDGAARRVLDFVPVPR